MVVTSLFSSTCAFNKLHLSSELVNENVSFKTIAMKMYVCKSCRKHKIHEIDDVDRKVLFIRTLFYEFPSCSLMLRCCQIYNFLTNIKLSGKQMIYISCLHLLSLSLERMTEYVGYMHYNNDLTTSKNYVWCEHIYTDKSSPENDKKCYLMKELFTTRLLNATLDVSQ